MEAPVLRSDGLRLVDCFCDVFARVLRLGGTAAGTADPQALSGELLELCEQARRRAQGLGMEEERIENALFAVAAWVDESILCSGGALAEAWNAHLLQRRLFDTLRAGDEFYDRLENLGRNDDEVLEVYAFCLALGFHGRLYADPAALEALRHDLRSRLGGASGGMERLFPAAYRTDVDLHGYRRPILSSLRNAALVVVPLALLAGGYYLASRHLGAMLHDLLRPGM